MDLAAIAPRLALGGIAPNREKWRFVMPVDDATADAAATCWVVPFLPDGQTVAVWLSSNRLHIPGGTLEAGESWVQGGRRELVEELGAEAHSVELFGAILTETRVRLTALAEIDQVAAPSEPETSGTYVVETLIGSPDEIIDALERDDQGVLADIYRLGVALRAKL